MRPAPPSARARFARGCAALLAVYVLVAAGYHLAFSRWAGEPDALRAAAWLAMPGALLLLAARGLVVAGEVERLIRRFRRGELKHDGERVAAVGRLEPLGEPALSPLRREPCVGYEYRIREWHTKGKRTKKLTLFRGHARVPCAIGDPQGEIRLLGFASFDRFPAREVETATALPRARELAASAPFEEIEAGGGLRAGLERARSWDGAERIRFDRRRGDAEPTESLRYEETVVPPGPVCAVGRYAARPAPALVATLTEPIVLFPGEPEQALEALARNRKGAFWLALILFVLSHAVGLPALLG